MFDDIAPQNPNEPEDILANAEPTGGPLELKSALANQKLKPVKPALTGPNPIPVREEMSTFATSGQNQEKQIEITPPILNKKNFFIFLGFILIVALGGLTTWGIMKATKKTSPTVSNLTNTVVPLVNENTNIQVNVNTPEQVNDSVNVPAAVIIPATSSVAITDTDGDGLIDEEENKYGTDSQKTDTDGDSLTDYEEIMIWKTDPLKTDTDGDGFNDGEEVKNGYNPLGAGKLLELPTQ
ncbi:MAG: S-layer domain-containing protein [Candidatus Magasanikbacteria bacterium GW2011_GWC2_40_17]|uniref:S-layer domain-containing protein n=1 Tax=Candidatus Magasanikbacteria bacterium GW2011_GWA2_42_32 TaxID=1619039 RepID=A0A0G1CDU9_9BACT|nr:MAG: S-layer domain-containing protein [Candidatus Magasanikbacteria bacterium GW2011_GWC2_40_17]KKS56876.1 MAG: S-layer domain-containing protein [Candidatus Magasanikbacteria bacterium GW2011_GWA2_42_32]OGH85660.1 MAG: hypothetical protein A2294_00170 [Candidatus Magasanikbacteria bacterium RIFOXYB2_FULL_38_10]